MHTIIRAIYARETISSAVLELNAGDDRGIHAIQDKIINFCKHTVDFVDNYMKKKIVILDEADSINSKAQRIINLIMDKYANTKFIFICNNSTDIIESIQSRCVIIRFSKQPIDKVVERLELISKNEKINYEISALKMLYEISHKDMRQTINLLELLSFVKGGITIENIELYCDIPSHTVFLDLLNYIIKKDIRSIIKTVTKFQEDGYYPQDILLNFIQYIEIVLNNMLITNPNYDKTINILNKLAIAAYNISKINSSYLQLTSGLLEIV